MPWGIPDMTVQYPDWTPSHSIYSLLFAWQKGFNPRWHYPANAVNSEFINKASMRHSVKSLTEVQNSHINSTSLVAMLDEIMRRQQKLWFTGITRSDPWLAGVNTCSSGCKCVYTKRAQWVCTLCKSRILGAVAGSWLDHYELLSWILP